MIASRFFWNSASAADVSACDPLAVAAGRAAGEAAGAAPGAAAGAAPDAGRAQGSGAVSALQNEVIDVLAVVNPARAAIHGWCNFPAFIQGGQQI